MSGYYDNTASRAAREAEKARIRAEIGRKQEEIADLEQQVRRLKEEVSDLHSVENNRKRSREKIETDLYERRHRVDYLEGTNEVCLCSRNYHEGMWEELHSVEEANLRCRIDEIFMRINREITRRKDKIEELECRIRNLREQIESLRSQL